MKRSLADLCSFVVYAAKDVVLQRGAWCAQQVDIRPVFKVSMVRFAQRGTVQCWRIGQTGKAASKFSDWPKRMLVKSDRDIIRSTADITHGHWYPGNKKQEVWP